MDRRSNILIVEDDTLLAERIGQYLIREGFNISGVAENLQSAISIMKKKSADLALIDIRLKGPEDGIVTAREIAKLKWIPIIYITGETSPETVEKCKPTSPAAYLTKPLQMRELIIQVELALYNFRHDGLLLNPNENIAEDIYVITDKGHVRVKTSEILFIEAERVHSRIFLTSEGYHRLITNGNTRFLRVGVNIGRIHEQLPGHFYRLSRSLCVNLNLIDLIGKGTIVLGGHEISLPEGAKTELLSRLTLIKNR